jgi:hypothetical protein
MSASRPTDDETECIHDKRAFLFLVILICKQCVIVEGLSRRKLLVYIGNLLLKLTQAVPVSSDIIAYILIQGGDSGHPALEEGM